MSAVFYQHIEFPPLLLFALSLNEWWSFLLTPNVMWDMTVKEITSPTLTRRSGSQSLHFPLQCWTYLTEHWLAFAPVLNRLLHNFVEGYIKGQGKTHSILVRLQIRGQIQDSFLFPTFTFSLDQVNFNVGPWLGYTLNFHIVTHVHTCHGAQDNTLTPPWLPVSINTLTYIVHASYLVNLTIFVTHNHWIQRSITKLLLCMFNWVKAADILDLT